MSPLRPLLVPVTVLLATIFAVALAVRGQTYGDVAQGFTPYQSLHGGDIDSINLYNGNVVLHIPLVDYPQRGALKLSFSLVYNSKTTQTAETCDPSGNCNYYWNYGIGPSVVDDQQVTILEQVYSPTQGATFATWAVVTADGAQHPLVGTSGSSVSSQITGDMTGFWSNSNQDPSAPLPTVIIDRNGVRYPVTSGGLLREDTNGNEISADSNNNYTDTLGRVIPIGGSNGINPGTSTTNFSGCTGSLATASAYIWSIPALSGGTMQIKFCLANVTINIPANGIVPASGGTATMLQSVVLPNGTAWTFQYNDHNSSEPANVNYGSLTQVTLPTGGTISYTYETTQGGCAPFPLLSRSVTSRTLNANDGSGPHTWTYNGLTVTDPLGNDTVHTFTPFGVPAACASFETQTKYYHGSSSAGTLLKTVQTDYKTIFNGNGYFNAPGVVPIRVTTTWPLGSSSLVTKVEYAYDPSGYGDLVQKTEYDFGSGTFGPLLRTTNTSYLALSNSTYLTNNLVSLVSSRQVLDGGGTQLSDTTYGYDEGSPASSGISTQHTSSPDGSAREPDLDPSLAERQHHFDDELPGFGKQRLSRYQQHLFRYRHAKQNHRSLRTYNRLRVLLSRRGRASNQHYERAQSGDHACIRLQYRRIDVHHRSEQPDNQLYI